MNYKTAGTSLSIKILTTIMLTMAALFILAGFHDAGLMIIGVVIGAIAFVCYLLAPASYEVSKGCLTVILHAGKRSFGPVVECARITERMPFTIRLFGNGGLFAGTGIFWNKRDGIFRAYATSARHRDLVMVRTTKYKVLVTPDDPQAFIQALRTPGSDPGDEG